MKKRDKKQYEEFKKKVQPKMVGFIDGMREVMGLYENK